MSQAACHARKTKGRILSVPDAGVMSKTYVSNIVADWLLAMPEMKKVKESIKGVAMVHTCITSSWAWCGILAAIPIYLLDF